MNKRLQKMITNNLIPNTGGVFIDAYNQTINTEIAGTITTRVDASNMVYVTEVIPLNTDKDGNCSCLKANYHKMGGVNFLRHSNDGFKATCIMEINKINKIGNYSPSGHNASSIVDTEGIAPAVMENHGTVTAVVEPQVTATTICLNSKVDGKQPSLEHRIYDSGGISTAMTTCFLPNIAEPCVMQVGNLYPDTDKFKNRTMGRIYDPAGLSPTINCCGGGDREPKVLLEAACLTPKRTDYEYRIRKLTPRECFRLMDVSEPDIDKLLNAGISNSQLYKLAGNSIVCSVIYHVMRKMFIEKENENQQLTLF